MTTNRTAVWMEPQNRAAKPNAPKGPPTNQELLYWLAELSYLRRVALLLVVLVVVVCVS